MEEDKYTKNLAKNQLCVGSRMQEIRKKRFTQIYVDLHGDAMLVSLWGAQIWPLETNRNICFWVFLQMHKFIAWGTHKD